MSWGLVVVAMDLFYQALKEKAAREEVACAAIALIAMGLISDNRRNHDDNLGSFAFLVFVPEQLANQRQVTEQRHLGDCCPFSLMNQAGKQFADVSLVSGLDNPADSRGFVLFDYDRDGQQDIALVNANDPLLNLYHNQIDQAGEPEQRIHDTSPVGWAALVARDYRGLQPRLRAEVGGEVTLSDRRVDGLPAHGRKLGWVPQDAALFPHMSARENIEFGRRLRGSGCARRSPRRTRRRLRGIGP